MKHCPFCGSTDIRPAEIGMPYAECRACGAFGPSETARGTPPEYGYNAVYLRDKGNELWNQRAEGEQT